MRLLLLLLLTSTIGCTSEASSVGEAHDHEARSETSERALESTSPRSERARVRFAETLEDARNGVFRDAFRLLGQRDIVTVIDMPAKHFAQGPRLVHFELRNPRGVVQVSKWYAVGTGADLPESLTHPSFPTKVPVQKASLQSGTASIFGKLPIAGTNFTRSRLQGTFTATVRVGLDAQTPLASHSFEMEL